MITRVRDSKNPSISFEEEINQTREVDEAGKKNEGISLGDLRNNIPREEEGYKLEVFEIAKLLLNEF